MKKIYLSVLLAVPILFNAQSIEGTWKLAQQAAALAVGPNQGDGSWWSNSANDLTVRDCFFDDSITFDANGNMMHYMDGSTWVEAWQGVASEQCGTPVAPHDGSGTYTYTFSNNQLTVNGLGAHIGLPKAINGGELTDPANAVSSITYEISFGANGEMVADIQSAGGGSGWWRFIYQKTNVAPPPPPTTYNVTLKVDASNIVVGASGLFAGGGVLGDAQAVQLTDPDGDNIYEGVGSFPASGGNYVFLNGPADGGDWGAKEDLNGLPCADASNWNDRLMPPLTSDTTVCFEYGTCTPCGGTPPPPPTTYNVTFEVHTDSLVARGGTVSGDGIYIGGGFVGGHDALLLSQTVNSDGKDVWTGTTPLNSSGGWFTILNGNCNDWSCKEDISGQSCADPGNFNDRNNLLGGFSNDTTIVLEYGDCTRPNSTTKVTEHLSKLSLYPNPTFDVINISSTSTITDYNIYNMIGNKVMSTNVNASNAVVDMSTLTKGVYFVEVNLNGIITNKRIIKK